MIYDIDQNILGDHIKELLNDAYHHSIKIQLNKMINNIDNSSGCSSSNNNNYDESDSSSNKSINYSLKENIIEIVSLVKSPHQLLNQERDVQHDFLNSPTNSHQIFKPIKKNLKRFNNIIQNLNNSSNNNQIIIDQLQQIYNKYSESHQSYINNLIVNVIPSFKILKTPALLFTEDLKDYQVKSLQLSYDMASYNPDEHTYQRNNGAGISIGSVINDKIYFKLDGDSRLLKPVKEYAVYQFYKYLYPTSTSTIISPTQLVVMDQLKILPPNHPVRKELGSLKTKHKASSIKKVLEKEPEFRIELDYALHNNNRVFLQASLFRNGISLEKYLEQCKVNNDINYNQINLESYSSHILASLLLIPTDYKPDNLILENGTNNIIGIDNDDALESFEFEKTPSGQVYPTIKNILYTLKSLMSQPVHQHVRDQFIQHNPSLFIIKWLLLIEKKHSNYYSLISKLFELNNTQLDANSIERRFNNIKNDNLNLPIHFNQGWIIQMYQRFKSIKQLLLSNTNITHQELFNQIHPLTSKYYQLLSRVYSSPLDQITSIYGCPFQQPIKESETNIQVIKHYPFNQLLDMVSSNLTYAEKLNMQQQIEQSISSNCNIKQSISTTIKVLIQNTNYNDLSECTLNLTSTELLNHLNSKQTKSTIIEWIELVYSIYFSYGNSDIIFYQSWYKEKESIIKLLLKHGSSVSIISNIIKSLSIIFDNNNFISIINHRDIINNNNIINQLEYLIKEFKLDTEMIHNNNTLLDLASTYNNIKLFKHLVDLGAGRKANSSVVSKFYKQLSYEEKSSLKSSLSKLFIINPKINWKISINQLFPLEKPNTNIDQKYLLSEVTSSTKRIISTEIWNKLFDSSTGQLLKSNEYGTRSVILIQDELGNGIYLKFKPQFPGIELAVHKLCEHIFQDDTLTPHCELASINQIPVLLSQQVPGEPLIDILERDQNILNQIEPSNISKQLVMAMLTNNADGNLANFILVPTNNNNNKYLLYSIDNDQSFMPSISKSNGILQGSSLQVDTVLFLFDQINYIVDQDVINSIKNLDIEALLISWLSLLKHHHQSSLDHFVSNKNQLKKDRETIVGVSFSDGMIEHLYSKLKRLKQLFSGDKSKSITHLQILESIEPLVYNRYKQAINNHLQPSIIQKYIQLKNISNYSKKLATCSINLPSQILQSRSIPDIKDIQDQLWSGKYGPSQALGQLNTLKNQIENLNQLLNKLKESSLMQNQNYIISNYDLECLLKADFDTITEDQQILFDYIKLKEISVINLKNSNQIDVGIIKRFNLYTIVILDLSGCNKIIYFEGTLSTSLYFKSLIKIKFNNCTQLASIKINSPNLEYISAENCHQLKAFRVDSSLLKHCNLKSSLSSSNILSYNLGILNSYYINRLEYLNISEAYYSGEITINSKSLKRLVMNSMNKLSKINLQVPSIELFSFEDCESLNEISTIKDDRELNYNLWNVLKQKDPNRLKEMNITINMVAAKQIYDLNSVQKDYILVPTSGPFIIPYDIHHSSSYFYKVSNGFLFSNLLLGNIPLDTLCICGELPRYLYYEQIPSTIKKLYLYDTYMVNTSNLDLEHLELGYGFRNEFTSDFKLPPAKRITIGETLHPLNTPTCFSNTDKLEWLVFKEYKYKLDTGSLPKVGHLHFDVFGEPLVKGTIHPDQEKVWFSGGFKQLITPGILPDKLQHLTVNTTKKFKILPNSIPTSNLTQLDTNSFTLFNKIIQNKSFSSNHLVIHGNRSRWFVSFQVHFKYNQHNQISSLKSPVDRVHYWIIYQPIIAGTIPQTIQYLYLHEVNHPLSAGSIPPSVTHLELCNGFNQQITKDIIPSSVKYLVIGNIVHPLNQYSIPKELEVLELSQEFKIDSLSWGVIPNTIKTLAINGTNKCEEFKRIQYRLSLSSTITIKYE